MVSVAKKDKMLQCLCVPVRAQSTGLRSLHECLMLDAQNTAA